MKTNTPFNPHIHYFYSEIEQRLLTKSSADDILDTMKEYSYSLHNGLGEIHIFVLQIINSYSQPHSNDARNNIVTEASRGLKDYVCSNKMLRNKEEAEKIEFKYANNDVV